MTTRRPTHPVPPLWTLLPQSSRRTGFGTPTGASARENMATPLVFHAAFSVAAWITGIRRSTMDWPAEFAGPSCFDNTGVAELRRPGPGYRGKRRPMTAAAFIHALGPGPGSTFSASPSAAMIAQALALRHRELGPQARSAQVPKGPCRERPRTCHPESVNDLATRHDVLTLEDFPGSSFLEPTERSPGRRRRERFWDVATSPHHPTLDVADVQADHAGAAAAIVRLENSARRTFRELGTITQPTLLVNGHRRVMVPTIKLVPLGPASPAPSSSS